MSDTFTTGDFLVFQVEAGFGLLRILDVSNYGNGTVWHIMAYSDLFMDIETAEIAIQTPNSLKASIPHSAMTERAFHSTQVSKLGNATLTDEDLASYVKWRENSEKEVSDRSVRLLLGLR